MRFEALADVLWERVAVLKTPHQKEAKLWHSILKLQKGSQQFANAFVAGQSPDE
jgi:hypothetical protein